MVRRFLTAFVLALLLQGTVFALYYDDLLFLRAPVAEIAVGSPDLFAKYATRALSRERLTGQHLDTIAAAAQSFGMHEPEIVALERRVTSEPGNPAHRLRLADALRRAGQFARAEALYLDVLRTARPNEVP